MTPSTKKETSLIKLKRQLTLRNAIGVVVGHIIGTGIFISPTGILTYAGSVGLSLCVWLLAGLMSAIGAHCFTELATMIPESGGVYSFLLHSFGEVTAFLFLWTNIFIMKSIGFAVMTTTCANYLLQPLFTGCDTIPDMAVRLLAGFILLSFTWLNCYSTKWAIRIQDILTFTKTIALIIIGGTGAYYIANGYAKYYKEPFAGSNWSFNSIATSYYQGVFAYAGWHNLNYLAEEMKNPTRDTPRAIWISVSLVTLVYCGANVAYFVLLSPEEMLSSKAVAVSFGSKISPEVAWAISILVAGSSAGGLDSNIISASRLMFSGAREGHFPKCFSLLNIHKLNPMTSILFIVRKSNLRSNNIYFNRCRFSMHPTWLAGRTVT